jgi:UDP-glucose 4-epimerase
VYGKSLHVPFREDDDVAYGPTTIGRWSYAYGKALDEYLALAHAARGLPAVVARFFNTVGPRQVGAYGMVLPRFVAAAVGGRPLCVFGDGTQTRCFCDARDVAPALSRLLRTPVCHGRVFNLGSDRAISIRELAELVLRETGSSSPITHVPYEEAYAVGFEDLARRQPDLTRIREAIGFSPSIGLEQTITDIAAEVAGS